MTRPGRGRSAGRSGLSTPPADTSRRPELMIPSPDIVAATLSPSPSTGAAGSSGARLTPTTSVDRTESSQSQTDGREVLSLVNNR